MTTKPLKNLSLRLMPLYASAFAQGLIFWYVIDKLFAYEVGVTNLGIGVAIVAMSVANLVTEIPSGILADRWSRKYVLIISNMLLLLATLFGFIGTEPYHFLLLSICWGAYHAMYTGTYEALVYDTLIEEQGNASMFENVYGKIKQLEGISLTIGTLLGGFMASSLGLSDTFKFTFIPLGLALAAILLIKEPSLHRATDASTKLLQHSKNTFKAISDSKFLVAAALFGAAIGSVGRLLWEFNQLWYINLNLPLKFFGVFNASLFGIMIMAPQIIRGLKSDRLALMSRYSLMSIFASGLLYINNAYLASAAVTLVMFFQISISIILVDQQQKHLDSKIRAGATSVLSTLKYIVSIPFFIVFGKIVDVYDISTASIVVTSLLVLTYIFAKRLQNVSTQQPK